LGRPAAEERDAQFKGMGRAAEWMKPLFLHVFAAAAAVAVSRVAGATCVHLLDLTWRHESSGRFGPKGQLLSLWNHRPKSERSRGQTLGNWFLLDVA
jgi:hypothetical protein